MKIGLTGDADAGSKEPAHSSPKKTRSGNNNSDDNKDNNNVDQFDCFGNINSQSYDAYTGV